MLWERCSSGGDAFWTSSTTHHEVATSPCRNQYVACWSSLLLYCIGIIFSRTASKHRGPRANGVPLYPPPHSFEWWSSAVKLLHKILYIVNVNAPCAQLEFQKFDWIRFRFPLPFALAYSSYIQIQPWFLFPSPLGAAAWRWIYCLPWSAIIDYSRCTNDLRFACAYICRSFWRINFSILVYSILATSGNGYENTHWFVANNSIEFRQLSFANSLNIFPMRPMTTSKRQNKEHSKSVKRHSIGPKRETTDLGKHYTDTSWPGYYLLEPGFE